MACTPRAGASSPRWLVALVVLFAGSASAQITNTSDVDPAPAGSFRAEIVDSTPDEVIDVQIGAPAVLETVTLRTTLVFDNDVTLDNSSTDAALVDLQAPDLVPFLQVADGVRVTLRDVGLANLAGTTTDDIELQGGSATLVLDYERAVAFLNVEITGAGGIEKQGAQVLELGVANTFSGGIVIDDGDVIRAVEGALGAGSISLAPDSAEENARLIFSGSGDFALQVTDDRVGGVGGASLVKRGAGVLDVRLATLAPTLAFSIEDGTLRVDDSQLAAGMSLDFEVASGSILAVAPAAEFATPSGFTGQGRLELESGGLIVQSDVSDFGGDFAVTGANTPLTFDVDVTPAAPLSSDVALTGAGSTLVLDDAVGVTFAGRVTGAGGLTKRGATTTRLTGQNTFTGPTTVSAGTLQGSVANLPSDVTLGAGAALVFDQPGNATWSNVVSGGDAASEVRKQGGGVLTIGQPQSFTGMLHATAGGLRFASGAGLTAAGLRVGSTSGGASVSLSTAFDPTAGAAAAANRIDVAGDLAIESNARVTFGVAPSADVNTQFAATGAVTLADGATIVVEPADGDYVAGTTWTLFSGASVSTGPLGPTIEQAFLFFDLVGTVAGSTYQLQLASNANTFASLANNANGAAVGAQLDAFRAFAAMPGSDIARVQQGLSSASLTESQAILDSVSPDVLSASTNVQLANAQRAWQSLSDRALVRRRGWIGAPRRSAAETSRERAPVDAGPGGGSDPRRDEWVAWLEGGGSFGRVASDDANEVEYLAGGPLVGADRLVAEDLLVGFALSGGGARYETESGNGEGDGGTVEASLYAAWLGAPAQVLVGGRYARAWLETDRTILTGSVVERADGDLEGGAFGAFAELSRAFPFSTKRGALEVAPLARFAWTRVDWQSLDEGGPSPLRVSIEEQEIDSLETSLGARAAGEGVTLDGTWIRPRLLAMWLREWGDADRDVTGRFASSVTTGLAAFTVSGAERPRDQALLGVGWDVGLSARSNLFLDWTGRFGGDFVENTVSLGGRVAW